MKIKWSRMIAIACLASGGFLSGDRVLAQDGVTQEFLPSGLTRLQGGYRPVRAEMDQEADVVNKTPEDLTNPKFGFLENGDQKWAFILDEPEEGDAKLYVDTNADGDLTNDPEAEWASTSSGGMTMYRGSAKVEVAPEKLGEVQMYRFDPADQRRAALKNTMLYYFDFGTQLTLNLDGKEFKTAVAGQVASGDALRIDRNGDGKTSRHFEMMTVGEPFNFTGTTYVLNSDAGELSLTEADEELPVAPLPPDLRLGKQALEFAATTTDGDEIQFPASYKGKVVMLDFWATWCGPCVAEIPNMKEAYGKWNDHGFEILGISFDRPDMAEKLEKYREDRELPWPQIYEGKFWDTSLGIQHDVSGIPFVLVVDGDTGEILGTSREARGPKLAAFVGSQLLKKGLITEEEMEAAMSDDSEDDQEDDGE